jgi:hypothetical protein
MQNIALCEDNGRKQMMDAWKAPWHAATAMAC